LPQDVDFDLGRYFCLGNKLLQGNLLCEAAIIDLLSNTESGLSRDEIASTLVEDCVAREREHTKKKTARGMATAFDENGDPVDASGSFSYSFSFSYSSSFEHFYSYDHSYFGSHSFSELGCLAPCSPATVAAVRDANQGAFCALSEVDHACATDGGCFSSLPLVATHCGCESGTLFSTWPGEAVTPDMFCNGTESCQALVVALVSSHPCMPTEAQPKLGAGGHPKVGSEGIPRQGHHPSFNYLPSSLSPPPHIPPSTVDSGIQRGRPQHDERRKRGRHAVGLVHHPSREVRHAEQLP
jgi:hypothetical protein